MYKILFELNVDGFKFNVWNTFWIECWWYYSSPQILCSFMKMIQKDYKHAWIARRQSILCKISIIFSNMFQNMRLQLKQYE